MWPKLNAGTLHLQHFGSTCHLFVFFCCLVFETLKHECLNMKHEKQCKIVNTVVYTNNDNMQQS